MAGVLGSACWRDAAIASVTDSEPPQVGRMALGLVAGAAAGLVLSLPAAASTTPAPSLTMASLTFYAAWTAVFAVGTALSGLGLG